MLNRLTHQTGMSLIEAMIALVVISVGLLGIAALQITALQQNTSSQWHSQAVWNSYEISDRILANSSAFNSYSGIDTSKKYDQDCQESACTSAEMVAADAKDWANQIASLPSGRGIISSPGIDQLTITVMWDDEGTGAKGTGCSGNTQKDLTCYTVSLVK